MTKPKIAFFGLGLMGSGMARRLLTAGFPVTVFNRNRSRATPLLEVGAHIADSPLEAVAGADFAISMLADDEASRTIWLGATGALAGIKKGAVLIESSTLTVDWIRELATAAMNAGCDLLDAPVTGSKSHAAAGELSFLVGGSTQALELARPVLAAMSRNIIPVGPSGSGALLKLINNFLCGVQAASVAEALVMIDRSNLEKNRAVEFLMGAAPGSPVLKTVLPRMLQQDFGAHFRLALMAKDLRYAQEEANRLGMKLEFVKKALESFHRAIDSGYGDQDFSAIVKSFRK